MQLPTGISLRGRSKDASVRARRFPEPREDGSHALAMQLKGDPEALRLSIELFEQIKAAGLDLNDPRIESLPAAVDLAMYLSYRGALWD